MCPILDWYVSPKKFTRGQYNLLGELSSVMEETKILRLNKKTNVDNEQKNDWNNRQNQSLENASHKLIMDKT